MSQSIAVCFYLLAAIFVSPSAGLVLNCDDGWKKWGGSCYLPRGDYLSWQMARNACQTYEADLLTIMTEAENTFIIAMRPSFKEFWTGLNDLTVEEEFRWLDEDTAATYTNWGNGEPRQYGRHEDCVTIKMLEVDTKKQTKKAWKDGLCASQYPFVCKKRIVPRGVNASTIKAENITSDSAILSWDAAQGETKPGQIGFQNYYITLSPTDGGATAEPDLVPKTPGWYRRPSTMLHSLTPGTEYTVTIKTQSDVTDELSEAAVFKLTFITVPRGVNASTIKAENITLDSAILSWDAVQDEIKPGQIGFQNYYITLSPTDGGATAEPDLVPKTLGWDRRPSTVLHSLTPGTEYTVTIKTQSDVTDELSEAAVFMFTTDGVRLCPAETNGGIPWSATVVGGSDTQMCMDGYEGMASRRCSKDANGYGWKRPSLVHCVGYEMQDVYSTSKNLALGINTTTVEASSARLRKITGEATLVSGELNRSVSIIENLVTAEEIRGSGTNLTEQNIVESASNILDMKYNSSWLDVQELYAGTAHLMKQMDRYCRLVSGRHVQNKWRVVPSKNIVLQTKKSKATEMNTDAKIQRVVFPDSALADMPEWANKETQISVDVKAIYGDAEVGLCGLQYKTLNVLLPKYENTTSISTVNSKILALSITAKRNTGHFDPPIKFTFKHIEKNFVKATCNFWDFSANKTAEMRKNVGAWSTAGCKLVVAESHHDYTTCECDHLTNFAILMSPSKTMKTPVALKYMTWIGCGISLVCLVMTVIIYAIYWKRLNSERSVILLNICVSLILALVTFLAGVERKENKHVCTAIAAMLHFFFLAVFSFMLMEGMELYILLVKVFAFGWGRKKWYILGGWGLPAVVVGISLGATQAKGYGNEDYCWLSLDNGLLWAFVVPALIIILVNCVFLGMAMKAILTAKSIEDQSIHYKAKHGVRGLCILMPLLGTTWVFGVLAVNNDTIAFQYIFTICNSLQGLFIFIFHCLMNKHLLQVWKEERGRRASSSGSSNTKPTMPRKTRQKKREKLLCTQTT